MNCHAKIQSNNATSPHACHARVLYRALAAGSLACALLACAPAPELQTSPSAPSVDTYRVEADAGTALALAQANARRLDTLTLRLDSLRLSLGHTDSALAALPLARSEETANELTLLREDLRFLRSFLENQGKVPLIQPPRQQPPTELPPAPAEYSQGMTAFDKGSYQAALSSFEKVPALYPENAWTDDAWYWAGESYLRSGDFARALAAFSKVFTYVHSDKHDDAQYQTGICYLRLGDRERATAELRKVEVLYPQSARVPLAKAELAKLQSH